MELTDDDRQTLMSALPLGLSLVEVLGPHHARWVEISSNPTDEPSMTLEEAGQRLLMPALAQIRHMRGDTARKNGKK